MLSRVPHPKWRDFLPLFPLKGKLAAPFDKGNTFFYMNGRNAIYHALGALGIKKDGVVLLPSFHCTALVDPVLHYGAKIQYYGVKRDLSLDFEQIETLCAAGADCLLFIHYFGFPAPVDSLVDIAQRHNIRLIEDCTHALFGRLNDRYMGSNADASVFSLRKTFQVTDGGILRLSPKFSLNVGKPSSSHFKYQIRMVKWTVESILFPNSNYVSGVDFSATKDVAEAPDKEVDYKKGPDSHEDPEFQTAWQDWSISFISEWLFRRAKVEEIVQKRIRNYRRLNARLSKVNGLKPVFPAIDSQVCPLGYPFLSESSSRVDYQLRKQGIPAFSFGEVLHQTLHIADFTDARFLSENLTILPIHQGLSDSDIDLMADVVKEFFVHHNQYDNFCKSTNVADNLMKKYGRCD